MTKTITAIQLGIAENSDTLYSTEASALGWPPGHWPRTGRMTWEPGRFWPAFVADIRYWLDESNEDQA